MTKICAVVTLYKSGRISKPTLEVLDDSDFGKPVPTTTKVACPHCGKMIKETGLKDHIRAKHKKD